MYYSNRKYTIAIEEDCPPPIPQGDSLYFRDLDFTELEDIINISISRGKYITIFPISENCCETCDEKEEENE
jgi:hypothetical protein